MGFSGCYTALITPLKTDFSIDWERFQQNIEYQIENNVSGILAMGTTGESPTMSWDEHNEVIEKAIEFSKERTTNISGTGSNNTNETLEGTKHAQHVGSDAVLLVDCYYNGPSSMELRKEYHGLVAEKFPDLEVIPYVIPGRTGCELLPEDLAILADEYDNVNAVKEATLNIDRMKRTRTLVPEDFAILSGDDDITYTIMTDPEIKGAGVISVMSNVAPRAMQEMCEAILEGDLDKARSLKEALTPLFGVVTVKTEETFTVRGKREKVPQKFRNPLPCKTLMAGLGIDSGVCRRPLGKMTKKGVEIVRNAVKTVLEKNPEILEPLENFYDVNIEERVGNDDYWKLYYQ
ncbi:MAG: 4-hydroxy-tetrahydrodipicolinate synthase [Candidatus Hydrothermarchaeota archaeon]